MFTGVKILSSGIRNNQKIRTIPAWNKGPSSDDIFTHLKALTVESNQTDTVSTFGSVAGASKYIGGVLAPNGFIYGIPCSATTVLKIDPSNDTVSTFGSVAGASKYIGGVLAPNGFIYGIPLSATTILKIDPSNDTVSTFGNLGVADKYAGGVLAPNGSIYSEPFNATTVLKILSPQAINPNLALSRLFNKY